jgi:hypothetical protein
MDLIYEILVAVVLLLLTIPMGFLLGRWFGWFVNYLAELATTRAKNAKERDMQGVVAGRFNPNQTAGYGQDLMNEKQRQEETKRTFIDKLFNRGNNNRGQG